MPPPKARSIDGSNRCILRVDRDCVERIHRAYAVAMALPSPRPRAGWKKAGRREKREERREKMAASSIHCIFMVSREQKEQRRERIEQREESRGGWRGGAGLFNNTRNRLHIYVLLSSRMSYFIYMLSKAKSKQ